MPLGGGLVGGHAAGGLVRQVLREHVARGGGFGGNNEDVRALGGEVVVDSLDGLRVGEPLAADDGV